MRAHAAPDGAARPPKPKMSLTMLRGLRNFRDQAPELHPRSLRFKDGWLERRFQDVYFDTNIQYIRIATVLGAVTWAALGPLAPLVVQEGSLGRDALIRYGLGVPTGLVSFALTYLPNYRRIWQSLISAAILFSGLVWVIHRALVVDSRPDWAYAGNMLILIFAYILSRLQFRYSGLVGVALILMHNVGALFIIHDSANDVIFGDYFLLVTAFIGTVGAYVLERSARLLFLRERDLYRERGRSEGLLRNILPEQIADRLKRRDPATERFGLEKIKTIGDAYMAVAGVPDPSEDDVGDAAQTALAMRNEINQMRWPSGDPMRVRIGMATGPAVAGVIGQRKFAYDLWGDTVNTAARMESNGIPNEIQVSDAVYRRLGDRYLFSDVHVVNLKGKGPSAARFLLGRNGSA
jgi:class 3 adenylate cyclase